MPITRTRLSLLLTALLAVSLAACGGGGSDTAADTGADTLLAARVAPPGTPGGGGRPPPPPAPAPAPPGAATPAPVVAPGGTPTPVVPVTAPNPAATSAAALLTLDLARLNNYTPVLPAYYDNAVAATDNTPAGTRPSNAVATLGRVLFYDTRLSVNNTVACASCHQQAVGFSDTQRFSVGFSGTALTTAHSMRLGNLRYWQPGSMFWDRRTATLQAQTIQPIQHPVEMGFDAAAGGMPALLARLNALTYYGELSTLAFGDRTLSTERIQTALEQFQRAMVSTNSRWDAGFAQVYNPAAPNNGLGTNVPGFSAQENLGRQLFLLPAAQGGVGCAGCHQPPTFSLAQNSRSNGLDAGETVLFKSPSLKNVALSGTFMHDGRFSSLEQVVEFYNSGVRNGPALDNRLRGANGQPRLMNLTVEEKAALVAFLRTLTDTSLTTDTRFSSPFR